MDFAYSEDQRAARDRAAGFAREALNQGVEEDDALMRFPQAKWERLADWGFFGLPVPQELGGRGLDDMEMLLTMEGLGQECRDWGLLFSAAVHLWVVTMPLLRLGTKAQRDHLLPQLMRGTRIGAFAVTEQCSGSDVLAMETVAEPCGSGWRLQGSKAWITNGPIADVFVCFARTGARNVVGGITAFFVDAGADGVTLGPAIEKMGLRTSPVGSIELDGVLVGADDVLGRFGFGATVLRECLEWERIFITGMQVGALEHELSSAQKYSRRRQVFGEPICTYQSISDRLVDMKLRLETSRLLVQRAAWLKSSGRSAWMEASMAKLWASECAVASGLDAIQTHGGHAYASGNGIERHLRDAVGSRIYSGTSEIQRQVIARGMGL